MAATKTAPTDEQVTELYARIHAVDLAAVPVFDVGRCIPRKERAALARKLFAQLGIKGVSVTAPNYSMAHVVDIRLPEMPFSGWAGFEQWRNESYMAMPDNVPAKANNKAKFAASQKLAQILAVAFPNHDDRSDSQTDYYDACWSTWG